jgi:hypothetical protein
MKKIFFAFFCMFLLSYAGYAKAKETVLSSSVSSQIISHFEKTLKTKVCEVKSLEVDGKYYLVIVHLSCTTLIIWHQTPESDFLVSMLNSSAGAVFLSDLDNYACGTGGGGYNYA